jgi:aldehyde dehydrogenase (NAD+)
MGYIESGKQAGATLHQGGDRHGDEGYFINPTIFTNVTPDMKIVQEEIFGPVGVVIKFEDEAGMLVFSNY